MLQGQHFVVLLRITEVQWNHSFRVDTGAGQAQELPKSPEIEAISRRERENLLPKSRAHARDLSLPKIAKIERQRLASGKMIHRRVRRGRREESDSIFLCELRVLCGEKIGSLRHGSGNKRIPACGAASRVHQEDHILAALELRGGFAEIFFAVHSLLVDLEDDHPRSKLQVVGK